MNIVLTLDEQSAKKRLAAKAMQRYGLHLDYARKDLATLLEKIPILQKAGLQDYLSSNSSWLETTAIFSETSGTTGVPLPTPRGEEDLRWNSANQASAYQRFISKGSDRVAILHPSILSPFIEASTAALRMIGIGHARLYPIPLVCDYARIFSVMEHYRITTIMSTPNLAYKLLYEFHKDKKNLPKYLCKLLLTGEPLSSYSIQNLKRILGQERNVVVAPFVYGSSEAATLMLGRTDGLFDPILSDFTFELRGRSTNETGYRLLVSWLKNGIMPILRYDTGDHFNITTHGSSKTLKFLGRNLTKSESVTFEKSVEKQVFSLIEPIYHFECSYNLSTRTASLEILGLHSQHQAFQELKEKLCKNLQPWEFKISAIPKNNNFLAFSPQPKLKKFKENSQ